jgi:uncharacterized protein with beta-barrel porin domain
MVSLKRFSVCAPLLVALPAFSTSVLAQSNNVPGGSAAANAESIVRESSGQVVGGILGGIARAAAGGSQKFGVWAVGSYTHEKFDNALLPYDGDTASGLVGLDYLVRDGIAVGLAAGYENTDMTTTFNAGTLKNDGYTVAPYVAFALGKYLTLVGTAGYSGLSNDETRTAGAVRGSFDSRRLFGATELSGNYRAENWVFNSSIGYIYTNQKDDSYVETGGGNNAVGGNTTKIGQARVGVKLGYDFAGIVPYVSARIEHEFTAPAAPTVRGQSVVIDDTGYVLGGGLAISRGSFSAGIEGNAVAGRSNLTEYQLIGNVGFKF